MSRVRVTNGLVPHTGHFRSSWGTTVAATHSQGTQVSTTDEVGHWDTDNLFLSDKRIRHLSLFEGELWNELSSPPWYKGVLEQFPIYGTNIAWLDPRTPFALPVWAAVKEEWISRMLPGKPHVNLPAVIGEAKDLPSLVSHFPLVIRDWGKIAFGKSLSGVKNAQQAALIARRFRRNRRLKAVKSVANALPSTFLWKEFGVDPTVSDAYAMLDLLDAILKAYEDLERIQRRGSLKRSLRISPRRLCVEDGLVTTQSTPFYARHNKVRVYLEKSWVTSRWEPLIPASLRPPPSTREMVRRAKRQILGLNASGLALAWWELLPWSWLVDWLADIQSRLELYLGNHLLLKLVSLCYCRTSTVDVFWHATSVPTRASEVQKAHDVRIIKERIPVAYWPLGQGTGADAPSLPAFDGRQIGILMSIAAQRVL